MTDPTLALSSALSSRARILRASLRDLVLRHAALAASEDDPIDGLSVDELERCIDAADRASPPPIPLAISMAHTGCVPPLAGEMSPEQIAASLARGDDPYAAGIDGAALLATPSAADLLAVCRLARLFDSPEAIEAATAPGAITVVTVPTREARKAAMEDVSELLSAFLRTGALTVGLKAPDADMIPRILRADDEPVQLARGPRRPRPSAERLDDLVGAGTPALVIVGEPHDLTPAARAVAGRKVGWPRLGTTDVIELLRATHSTTGQLAEGAVRAALPDEGMLDALPQALWQRVLPEASPLRVARRLAAFAAAMPKSDSPTLADLHGQPTVRDALEGLAADLRAWAEGRLDWSGVSPSLLLAGPPGTGKTVAAACLAGSAGATLVSTSYAECQRYGHLGDYLAAMSDKVEEAVAKAPSVFFLDELDSFASRDPRDRSGRYMTSVVNGLLEHLSRLHATPGVAIIAATNHPGRVDPAVTRAGRFDRHLTLDLPSRAGLEAILRSHIGSAIGERAVDVGPVAARLVGRSGADVAAVARLAAGRARRGGRTLTSDDLLRAAREIAPLHDAKVEHATAVHEAGHIVVAAALGLSLTGAARLTDRGGEVEVATPALMTTDDVDARLTALLAGRAAEAIILGMVSHGAGSGQNSDLEKATDLVLRTETQWGLAGTLFHAPVPRVARHKLPHGLRRRLEHRLAAADRHARDLVDRHRADVSRIADALREERELDPARLADLTKPVRISSPSAEAGRTRLATTLH